MNTLIHHLRGPLTAQRRLAVIDLVAFVLLALGIGLAAGIVLGGTVLLLGGGDPVTVQGAVDATIVAVR